MSSRSLPATFAVLALLVGAVPASAQKHAKPETASDKYDEQLSRYLESARQQAGGGGAAAAPSNDWMNGLMGDRRARRLNDLVTIKVVESITASGTADSNLSKASSGTAGVPKLFGAESKLPSIIDPTSLASAKSDTSFKGAGSTTRAGDLSAVVTGRVAEVLPNGDLFIESVREITINDDRQVVVLTGVARVTDISPGNVVLSTSLGELQIRYFGRGLMKDNLSPGWLVRILNKIF
ncbi:MAG: flagellar basal body L-ring protein FlgH [Acidobacteria bacterium]|nr:flagellar basal body L-ring protein FlgH [Acidobacteriota bacterium]